MAKKNTRKVTGNSVKPATKRTPTKADIQKELDASKRTVQSLTDKLTAMEKSCASSTCEKVTVAKATAKILHGWATNRKFPRYNTYGHVFWRLLFNKTQRNRVYKLIQLLGA